MGVSCEESGCTPNHKATKKDPINIPCLGMVSTIHLFLPGILIVLDRYQEFESSTVICIRRDTLKYTRKTTATAGVAAHPAQLWEPQALVLICGSVVSEASSEVVNGCVDPT